MSLRDEEQARLRLERSARLDRAHLERPSHLTSFLGLWALGLLRPCRAPKSMPPPPEKVEDGFVAVTWVGHATTRIQLPGTTALTDPHLGHWVLAAHRATRPALSAQQLHDAELLQISHAHRDHLHRASLRALAGPEKTIVLPVGCTDLLSGLPFEEIIELDVGESYRHREKLTVTMVPARHYGTRRPLERARRAFGGFVLQGEGPSVYYAGDSAYFSGFAEVGRRFRPEIAILPIGGYAPPVFRRDHMSPLDALQAFDDLGARILIPVRHGSFRLSHEPLDEPRTWLAEAAAEKGQTDKVRILEHGETFVLGNK